MNLKIINWENLSDELHWTRCDERFGSPVALKDFDFQSEQSGFVYCREYGIFPCSQFSHQQCMATIVAWEHGFKCYWDMQQDKATWPNKRRPSVYDVSDMFFTDRQGRAFSPSKLTSGKPDVRYKNRNDLTVIEKRWLTSGGRGITLID